MTNLIVELTKYLMIFFFALYTYEGFSAFRAKLSEKKRSRIYHRQLLLMYLIHLSAYLAVYAVTEDVKMVLFYLFQVLFTVIVMSCYHLLYENGSKLLVNHMCMLLLIGFIILTRLSFEDAVRQYVIAAGAFVLTLPVPYLVRSVGFMRRLTWLYAAVGLLGLLAVQLFGATSHGAKLSLKIAGISFQPSEFIKLVFVFFVACMLYERTDFLRVCLATAVAAAHVLILVLSRDLGGALIFFITYVVMLYVATKQLFYFAGGLLSGSIAAVIAYNLFSHVQIRVLAWRDPLSVIDNEGYQISQSLFAIGTGGWFGMGLYQGMPNRIPVVKEDFIFSAIAEELGGIFALCLLMVCMCCFFLFLNMAMQMKDQFYKLIALGLGVVYGFQVFLTVGGVTRFIPSTGVTLPLVSYGGSSLLASMMMFAIVQGLYVMRQDEGNADGSKNKKTGAKEKRKSGKTGFDSQVEKIS